MIRGSFENLHNDFNEIGVRGFILSGAPFEKFVKNQLIGCFRGLVRGCGMLNDFQTQSRQSLEVDGHDSAANRCD